MGVYNYLQKLNDSIKNLLSDATIATKIDVVDEELWNKTVARTPIIKPATGFEATLLDLKISPRNYVQRFQYFWI